MDNLKWSPFSCRKGCPQNLVALDQRIEGPIKILEDLSRPDAQRIRARDALNNAFFQNQEAVVARLIKLGEETQSDDVRMHVAILFAETRKGPEVIPPALGMLTRWLESKSADAALRYWAARAIANAQSLKALAILKEKALAPENPVILRGAAARDLAGWPKDLVRKEVVKLFVGILNETEKKAEKTEEKKTGEAAKKGGELDAEEQAEQKKKAEENRVEMRLVAIDALRLTDLREEMVIDPLIKVALDDPNETAWRAAASALWRVGGGILSIPPEASVEERQDKIRKWEKAWRSKRRIEQRATKKEE